MSVPGTDAGRYGERPATRPGGGRSRAERSRREWLRGDRPRGERLRGERSRRAWLRDDRGQLAVEFVGITPVILATVVLLWQAALVGYTFSLAGNAADEAVRAGTVAETESRQAACERAGAEDLPAAWSADISCTGDGGDLVKAEVNLEVPVLFPGFNIPVTVPGRASAIRES
ncbi:TadE/TadG family type IV pilus assembly protein [Streptomyces scopuliridis]|uniref:TadE/TadG family type IV pilus assembly protein n=1 Tax=Streptomyces scopuliridis TaxID=452529 RepID=UPI00367C0FE8